MIVAIMQPYFFPYIGYFQLMRAVDTFVFFDDVQFIKRGWINRNLILRGRQPTWVTLPLRHDSQTLSINSRRYLLEQGIKPIKNLLQAAYAKAPHFRETYAFLSELLDFNDPNVATFNANLLSQTALRLGITCRFINSSEVIQQRGLRGNARILDLCKTLNAERYINPIGGLELYHPAEFAKAGITLSFLQTSVPPTPTDVGPQQLSVIDGLMRIGFDGYISLLSEYTLRQKEDFRTPA